MLIPRKDEYWDFVLSQYDGPSMPFGSNLTERCLAIYIVFGDPNCQWRRGVASYDKYYWFKAKNDGVLLEDIGYTGIDNGLIYYGGCSNVTNKEFYDIFTNSKLEIPEGDFRFRLQPVTGNTEVYSYDYEYVKDQFYRLKGGFLQGFYKLYGFDYQLLPQYIELEWNVEMTIRPMDYILDDKCLNATYPENSGIFFYMGTRAENKFAMIYETDLSKYEERVQPEYEDNGCEYFMNEPDPCWEEEKPPRNTCLDSYFKDEYAEGDTVDNRRENFFVNDGYAGEDTEMCPVTEEPGDYYAGEPEEEPVVVQEPEPEPEIHDITEDVPACEPCQNDEFNKKKAKIFGYFLNVYGYREFSDCQKKVAPKPKPTPKPEPEPECDECFKSYLEDGEDYYDPDVVISGGTLTTKDGKPIDDSGYYEFETDNKFLTFNRTKHGFTVATYDENAVVILTGSTKYDRSGVNLYLLMHRAKGGYTVKTIDQYFAENAKQYDLVKDMVGNAFALKYNDDGSITYRYLVLDCDNEERYAILSETSFPGIVRNGEWNTVNVKFRIINGNGLNPCGIPYGKRKMRIYIYVNGYLKFVSRELPEFNFRELKDIKEKQEAVPFNISVGGGTQGLCDGVWLDYHHAFEKVLPIEKNFAGTFIGDVYDFKFYTCPLEYMEIRNNYLHTMSKLGLQKVFIKK